LLAALATAWPRSRRNCQTGIKQLQRDGSELGGTAEIRGRTQRRESPPPAATKKPCRWQGRERIQGCNQAWGGVIKGVAIRLRRRGHQPKAAAAPKMGTGPGTFDVGAGPAQTCDFSEVPFNTHSPSNPDVLDRPKSARVLFTKVIDAERGAPRTQETGSATPNLFVAKQSPDEVSALKRSPVPKLEGPVVS